MLDCFDFFLFDFIACASTFHFFCRTPAAAARIHNFQSWFLVVVKILPGTAYPHKNQTHTGSNTIGYWLLAIGTNTFVCIDNDGDEDDVGRNFLRNQTVWSFTSNFGQWRSSICSRRLIRSTFFPCDANFSPVLLSSTLCVWDQILFGTSLRWWQRWKCRTSWRQDKEAIIVVLDMKHKLFDIFRFHPLSSFVIIIIILSVRCSYHGARFVNNTLGHYTVSILFRSSKSCIVFSLTTISRVT